MAAPQVAQPVQICNQDKDTGAVARSPALVANVDSASQVDVIRVGNTNSTVANLPYVEVGGTPPAAGTNYAQEIA